MAKNRHAAPLALAAGLALAACGGSDAKPGAPGGNGPAAQAGPVLGKKLPKYTPSGMKDDYNRYKDLEKSVKDSKKLDEQAAAKKAMEDFLKDFPARWEG